MTYNDSDWSYNGNPNLTRLGYQHPFTQEEIEEYIKCKDDPIYFIENYVYVVHPDKGKVLMKLFPYQKEMILSYITNRKTISLTGRQLGKCFCINTIITIKNKNYNNGEPFEITIGNFYLWQEFIRRGKEILMGQVPRT
jgi:hypothetical protein